METQKIKKLLKEIRACQACPDLPLGPRPVVNFSSNSKILIIGQAPGTAVHKTGIPWNDPSGDRLREWMKLEKDVFYDVNTISIVPMGFCYPGKGKSGDLPPRKECQELWWEKINSTLEQIEITLLIGQYSQKCFLGNYRKKTLAETVRSAKEFLPRYFPLPHPSPRNNIWLKKNPWFEKETIPLFAKTIQKYL